ncbi:hypothetical protein TD95_002792 [Thielaviopsis punctulata]|uniref:Uncharacterized protein n=1 Tax=Thielaviopsis punctulata TaxID=72032 RepID=A0A0F4ZI05_9PEZI|nr:hypothetical protein TD95_002792 [Thielaviopsis punctulata]
MAPSIAPSLAPSVDSVVIPTEITTIASGLERMENKALSSQRVILSEERSSYMAKLALGAKLDRALDRRMSSQDAVMRPRAQTLPTTVLTEKPTAAV